MADNFYGITDMGKMRDNNEDNFIAQTILSGKYVTGCVIDGVGGYEGGEVAAALARSAILSTIKKNSRNVIEVLTKALTTANQKINYEKQAKGENMQMACVATLALADIHENKFYYAHVGDTRLYLFRDHSLIKVSHDHSFVGFLEDSGRISEEAAMTHPKRNEINKALGFNEENFSEPDYIETGESPFLPGDILLLCSDGLSDMVNNKTITDILNSPESVKEKCKALIDAANAAGGKDNITVVIIRNNKLPLKQDATRPVAVKKNESLTEDAIKVEKDGDFTHDHSERKKSSINLFLIPGFVLLAVLAWFTYSVYSHRRDNKAIVNSDLPASKIVQKEKLSGSINNSDSKEIFLENLFGQRQSTTINELLYIQKDSLHINGDGIRLIADSTYKGAAIILSRDCKYILLDSITLENFDIGISIKNNALHLKNVRFKNCRVPVLYEMQLQNDKNISGNISD
ncbi:MAG TPA: protein phosphatase 2C domain-containing protein, partial [Chitinophagaceae bacterium]